MPDKKAEAVVRQWNAERGKQSNVLNTWQETADHIYPYMNITATYSDGTPRTNKQYDVTPMLDMYDMVAGLKHVLIPMGQPFFAHKVHSAGGQKVSDMSQRYLAKLTESVHEALFASNYITEFDEVLISLICFGPGCCATTWKKGKGLQFRSSDVGTYVLLEDPYKNVIGSIHSLKFTAAQAYSIFGENAGANVLEAMKSPEHQGDIFEFLHKVAPRESRNGLLPDNAPANSPYTSIYVNLKENTTADEGSLPEDVYQYARWRRPGSEKDGRGIGTEILPIVRVLFQNMKDFIECANRHNNPPREALDSLEGTIRTYPGGINWVQEIPSIRALDSAIQGNFPITEKTLAFLQDVIHRAFFKNAFAPLDDLTGDRRTTLEIRERIRGTLPKIGPSVNRLWNEYMTKQLERTTLLLIRNREVPQPPEELQGSRFGIEFVGPFALALRSAQAQAAQEWVGIVSQLEAVFPGAKDNVDSDDMIIRMGRTFGVNEEDMASTEERDAKRQKREQQLQQEQAMKTAELAANAYSKTGKAPEAGSAAQQVQEQMV